MKYEDFKDKPLPNHPKIDYYESLAKVVLEKLLPDEFEKLEIKDKPDLQNTKKNIGIEVTRAINSVQAKNESLYLKISYNLARNNEKAIKTINSSYKPRSMIINGKEIREPDRYNEGILVGIPEEDNFKRILESFSEKINRLNSGEYKIFLNNYLFVFSEILANQEMIDQAISDMQNLQSQYEKKFSKVFVYVPEEMYVLNLERGIGEILDIKEYQFDLSRSAREFVIQNEIKN